MRRRWPRMPETGVWLAFVAFGSALHAPHPELVADVESLLRASGALRDEARP